MARNVPFPPSVIATLACRLTSLCCHFADCYPSLMPSLPHIPPTLLLLWDSRAFSVRSVEPSAFIPPPFGLSWDISFLREEKEELGNRVIPLPLSWLAE